MRGSWKRLLGASLAADAAWSLTGVVALAKSKTSSPNGLTGMSSPGSSLLNLFLSLAVIIVLVILTIRFLARKTQVKQSGSIEILAARQLAPNRFVEVIEVQGKRYLVGVGDQVTLLADVSDSYDATESLSQGTGSFGQSLTDAIQSIRDKYRRSDEEGRG